MILPELFDTHVHLDDSRFQVDRKEVIQKLPEQGITRVINVGADRKSSQASIRLAEEHDFIYASVGIHPHDSKDMTEDDLRQFAEDSEKYNKVIAIGEIGLDYHYDNSPREIQQLWFERQLQLAKELNLPAILHIREAFGDAETIMRKVGKVKNGVVHCFGGSVDFADFCIKYGYHIGVGGVLTFSNAKKLVEVVKHVPLEKILLETDCPYMAPTPHRGERNEPAYVRFVAQKLAELLEKNVENIAKTTYQNALEVFGL